MARKTHKSSEEARNAILDAAQELMLETGPAGLRINAVAKKAGMAHPNIIHHFGSREGLIEALAEHVGRRSTERITQALNHAAECPPENRIEAITRVFEEAFQGEQGRASIWLHMSGEQTSLKENMQKILEVSHRFRETIEPSANLENTNRLVMLITLALIGEAVSGQGIKDALGFGDQEMSRAYFKQWLAEILINLSDEQLNTSLNNNE